MQGQGGSAPKWSVALHWVSWPWGFLDMQAKVSPYQCFAWGCPSYAIKLSEKAPAFAGLGDSQAKPNCETNLPAASAHPGAH